MKKNKKFIATLIFVVMLISFAGSIVIAKEETADYCPHWPWTREKGEKCVKHYFGSGNWCWACSPANEDDYCIR
jgi:hypothetical protein